MHSVGVADAAENDLVSGPELAKVLPACVIAQLQINYEPPSGTKPLPTIVISRFRYMCVCAYCSHKLQ